jgi:hypothetical protein
MESGIEGGKGNPEKCKHKIQILFPETVIYSNATTSF